MPDKRTTDGNIRQRRNGVWEARYTAGYDLNGKQIQKSVYASDERAVKRKLRMALAEVEMGQVAYGTGTLGEWLDSWMKDYKFRALEPITYTQYTRIIETIIKPAIGQKKLASIKTPDIQKFINSLQRDGIRQDSGTGGYSTAYIQKIRNMLHDAFDQAATNGMIIRNPVNGVEMPKQTKPQIRVLSHDEQERFIKALDGFELRPMFMLALCTGMRRGELLGLTWDCVDFRNKTITVRQSATRYKDPVTGQAVHTIKEPKTWTSYRKIPMVDNIVPILRNHMQSQRVHMMDPNWNPNDLVFCSSKGTIIEANTVNRYLNQIIKRAELEKFSMHALRHTFATRMMEAGVPAKVVQEMLGHKDVALTLNTYTHVTLDTAHREIAKINNLIDVQEPQNPGDRQPDRGIFPHGFGR